MNPDDRALTRAQWEQCIPIIDAALDRGEAPGTAARLAYDALPAEAAVGAMFALSAYALPIGDRFKPTWGWADEMGALPHAKAKV